MRPLALAIVGYGKIAADSHVPAIAGNPRLRLAATVSRQGKGVDGVPGFTDHAEMLAAMPDLDAVAITTPPGPRHAIARDCIAAGLHVLLEKPPAATLSEGEDLACLAAARQVSLFATWHARHHAAVDAAAAALAGKRIAAMDIVWHEDVRKWHPGQQWIWEPGGFGVFDPGINALSIAARIFPGTLFVRGATLQVPENRAAPIAAALVLASPEADGALTADFDWRRGEGEEWTIRVRCGDGCEVHLSGGGATLAIDGQAWTGPESAGEYADIYAHFIDLIDTRASDVDLRPLRLVADAFLLARRVPAPPFNDRA